MIQGNTWHEYSNELKLFLCDVAKSRWARYLFYPLGVFVAIMYMTSQAGAHPYSFFSYVCDFAGCIVVIILCTMAVLSCIFTADYPYDRLRRRNKDRDNQRIIAAFRKEYDKETELRIQRDNELVRRQVIVECQKQQKAQLDEIRQKQKDELEILQGEIKLKKQELESCKKRYEQNYQNLENVHKKSEEKITELTQDIVVKKRNIEELEAQFKKLQDSYNHKIEELKIIQAEEMDLFKQRTVAELRDDKFDLYNKVMESLEKSREEFLRENSERVKNVTTYAVMELAQFGFSPESYAFIQHKVCTFAETGGKFDRTELSPIVNPFKNDDARKRGRKKKANIVDIILTTQDIAHYTRNIAFYLDFRLEDVARFTAYLFKDWYSDGDFLSIAKAAAKSPDSGFIKIHENLEEYKAEQGWREENS